MAPHEWADPMHRVIVALLGADTISDMMLARATAWRLIEQYEEQVGINDEQQGQ